MANKINPTPENTPKQNRHWVRISAVCNNKCLFCLDSDAQNGDFIDETEVRKTILEWFKVGEDNRLILSGGEASINPKFVDYIRYGKGLWYNRIQTITNGNRFSDLDFCQVVFEAWLWEVTFSMHGHTEKLHDYFVDTPGAFKKSLQGIINIRKHFPEVILNIDIVVNKMNVRFLPDMIRFWMKLGIMEFDILQIIPFGRGFAEHRSELFYNPKEYTEVLQETWKLSRIPGMYMWTNRFPVEVLEWYEELIQDPRKIQSETMGEWRDMFEAFIEKWVKPDCFWERCNVCFIQQYCHDFLNKNKKVLSERGKWLITESWIENEQKEWYLILRWEEEIEKIRILFWKTPTEFIERIKSLKISDNAEFVNIPRCIRNDHNQGKYENYSDVTTDGTLGEYTKEYIKNLYRKKSLRCNKCKYNTECEGIHINFIRTYGFKILQPIK